MNWRPVNDYYALSSDGRFVINKTVHGGRIVYTAVRLGKPWRNGQGFDGSEALHVERNIDPDCEAERRAAIRRCQSACEAAGDV